jgi:hypothetical protein
MPTPYWTRNFRRYDELTVRFARTLAEVEADPYAFIEGPERGGRRLPSRYFEAARWLLSLILLLLMVTAPRWWHALFGG